MARRRGWRWMQNDALKHYMAYIYLGFVWKTWLLLAYSKSARISVPPTTMHNCSVRLLQFVGRACSADDRRLAVTKPPSCTVLMLISSVVTPRTGAHTLPLIVTYSCERRNQLLRTCRQRLTCEKSQVHIFASSVPSPRSTSTVKSVSARISLARVSSITGFGSPSFRSRSGVGSGKMEDGMKETDTLDGLIAKSGRAV